MPGEDVDRLRIGMRLVSSAVSGFADATSDYQRLLDTVVRSVAWVVGDACVLLLLQPDGSLLATAAHAIEPEADALMAKTLEAPRLGPDEPSITWDVLRSGRSTFITALDLAAARPALTPRNFQLFTQIGATGLIVVALRVRGEPIGVLSIVRHRRDRPALDDLDLELAQDLANHAALAISNAQLVAALRESEQLRRAEQETARVNRFLDAVIEHIPDMVFVKDADRLAFTRFNRAGEALLGVARGDLIGKIGLRAVPGRAGRVVPGQGSGGARRQGAGRDRRGADRDPPRSALAVHQEGADPRRGWRAALPARDLAGHHRAQACPGRAASRPRSARRRRVVQLEAFSYSVAHDLRAPLRGIDGFSQALLDDYGAQLDDTGRRYLARVREAAQRMALLIDDLLALSRVTRAELTRARVDLTAVAHACIARLRRLEPGRALEVVIAPDLVIHADERLLTIALDNLFGNAWKFTGKVDRPRIELGSTIVAGERAWFVRDNGAGFDMQYVHKLFGVFQRLHADAEFPGTGIGLATVARIIHRHRGRVWAEGTLGHGATFYFTLGDPETT